MKYMTLCLEEEETTEHMFQSSKLKRLMKHQMNVESVMEPSKELATLLEQAILLKGAVDYRKEEA